MSFASPSPALLCGAIAALHATDRTLTLDPTGTPGLIGVSGHSALTSGEVVALAYRLDESTLAYVGYARGPTQNLIKGGVGFSFR